MDWIVISGVKPYDGRYELDLEGVPFTRREWGWIKRLAGYLPLTIEEGFAGGDPELFTAFAVIALHRAGVIRPAEAADVYERFADVDALASVTLETDPAAEWDGDADSPPPPSSSVNGSSSGDDTTTSSETSPPTLPATGDPGSAFSESVLTGSGS